MAGAQGWDDMATREYTQVERRVTVAGLLIVFLLAALDQTIVSTAMPRIISDLDGLALYAWVTTAYLLTSTVMVPIWGKLSDLIGRKPVLLASILFFVAGSWFAGLSGEFGTLPLLGDGMTQLVIFRAVQGIGGGGLFTTATTIIADLYPPTERAKLGGLFGAVFGLSSMLGPLIGGYFTDHGTVHWLGHTIVGWRWVFYLNLPLSALALFMIVFKMPKMSHAATGRLDVPGAMLIVGAIVPLLLALSWGGQSLPWTSTTILALFGGSAVALAAYAVAERHASDPIVPLSLFRNRVFTTANIAAFLVAISFISTIVFLPMFTQIAGGMTATGSGLSTLPLMVGLMVSAVVSGRIVARTGAYRATLLAGLALTALGLWLLSEMHADVSEIDLAWRMLVLGIGVGPGQSLYVLLAQEATPVEQRGVVTASSQFFRQIGSTIGVALFGTALAFYLKAGLGKLIPGADLDTLRGMSMASSAHAGATLPDAVREAIAVAITSGFRLGILVVAVAFVVTLLIPFGPKRRPDHASA
jgi:EmrB/QacA subfamily drug resistance transporter